MQTRLIFGIMGAVLFLVCMWLGPWWISVLLASMAIAGWLEWNKLNGLDQMQSLQWIGIVGVLFLILPWQEWGLGAFFRAEAEIWLLMLALFSITVWSKNRITYTQTATMMLGLLYIGFGFHYMLKTVWINDHGMLWALLVFLLIWSTDSGAYFVGRTVGKHKLIPDISPNKTVEGAYGGVMIALLVSLGFSMWQPQMLDWMDALVLGFAVAFFAQLGDLIQSAYKRVLGVKDSGHMLPGHGGILDRCDSWLIVFPIVHLLGLIP
jgi:phosphatidate cytidylyltransferase